MELNSKQKKEFPLVTSLMKKGWSLARNGRNLRLYNNKHCYTAHVAIDGDFYEIALKEIERQIPPF